MSSDPQLLAEKLRSEGSGVHAFFAALTDEQWQITIYTDGASWTSRSVLAHLLTAERGFLRLFEGIRQGGEGASQDFSIDRYNARQQQKTAELTPAELLLQFDAVRREMVAYVSSLSQADLAASGRHPGLGLSTLEAMIKMIYIHNNQHLRDIRTALQRSSSAANP